MNSINLLTYLQQPLSAIPTSPDLNAGEERQHGEVEPTEIRSVTWWKSFDCDTVLANYRGILRGLRLFFPPPLTSLSQSCADDVAIASGVEKHMMVCLRRTLHSAFTFLSANLPAKEIAAMSCCVTENDNSAAFYVTRYGPGANHDRAIGSIRASWSWNANMASNPTKQADYFDGLSQVNHRMRERGSRYGFILTDSELVAIRRLDNDGNLEVSAPIPFTRGGSSENPQMTVMLAMWYLGMLAAQEKGPDKWCL